MTIRMENTELADDALVVLNSDIVKEEGAQHLSTYQLAYDERGNLVIATCYLNDGIYDPCPDEGVMVPRSDIPKLIKFLERFR